MFDRDGVENYYKMFAGYDNKEIILEFKNQIPKGIKVLELGFGTGADYLVLKDEYRVTPSDYSKAFIDKFYELYGEQAIQIDASHIKSTEKYDCIYSNKVLNALNPEDLEKSFSSQYESLEDDGFIFHTLWDESEDSASYETLRVEVLLKLIKGKFKLLYYKQYEEIFLDDSYVFIAKKIK